MLDMEYRDMLLCAHEVDIVVKRMKEEEEGGKGKMKKRDWGCREKRIVRDDGLSQLMLSRVLALWVKLASTTSSRAQNSHRTSHRITHPSHTYNLT